MFPLNAKKVQICKIMFGGFAVKNQLCIKKVWQFLVTFSVRVDFFNFAIKIFNQLFNASETEKRNPN